MRTGKEQREDGKVKAETRSLFRLNTMKLEAAFACCGTIRDAKEVVELNLAKERQPRRNCRSQDHADRPPVHR